MSFQRFLEDFAGDLSQDLCEDTQSSQIFDQEDETVSLNIFELTRASVYHIRID